MGSEESAKTLATGCSRLRMRWAIVLVAISLLNGVAYCAVLVSRSRHAQRVAAFAAAMPASALRGSNGGAAVSAALPAAAAVTVSSRPPPPPLVAGSCANFETVEDADYAGFDLNEGTSATASSVAICCKRCAARATCAGFTYHRAGAACFLKTKAQRRVAKQGYIAGKLRRGGAPQRAAAAAVARPVAAAIVTPAVPVASEAVGHHAAATRVVLFTAADRGYVGSKSRIAPALLRSGQKFRVLESYALSRMCYCLRHGYTLHADVGDIADEATPMHVTVLPNKWFKTATEPEALKAAAIVAKYSRRILVAQKLMRDRSARYVMFADMDVFVADQSLTVDSIVAMATAEYGKAASGPRGGGARQCDFIAQDSDHVVNSGWWIVRNTAWSRDFIQLWRTQVETGYTWMYDQGGLQNALLHTAARSVGATYANECLQPNPDAHLMNLCYRDRMAKFGFAHGARFFDRVCLVPASTRRLNVRGEYVKGDFLLHASIITAKSSFERLVDTCDLHNVPAS